MPVNVGWCVGMIRLPECWEERRKYHSANVHVCAHLYAQMDTMARRFPMAMGR